MRNLWLVARQEYRRIVLRRSFIVVTLAIPIALVAVAALAVAIQRSTQSQAPLGYVDHSGILEESRQAPSTGAEQRIPIREYPDEAAADAALQRNEIQAFIVIPPGYPDRLDTKVYYLKSAPGQEAWADFQAFLRANLVAAYPAELQARLLNGPSLRIVDVDSGRVFSPGDAINIVVPIVTTFFFMLATASVSGYMVQIVADEKENRTMEVLLTSMSPTQMILGKALGLLGAALTQLAVYAVAAVAALLIAAPLVPGLQGIRVPWGYLGMVVLFFFSSYVFVAATMVAIGSAVTEVQQGQQVGSILSLLFLFPLFMIMLIFESPSHPLVQFMTLFPTTSFLTIGLRWAVGSVPLWQIALAWAILTGSAAIAVWLAIRIFRAGMLRYGQPMTVQAVVAAIRGQ